jgi:uncharacterized protein YrrD
MKKYDEILSLPVLSTKEGKNLGTLSRAVVDPKDNGVIIGFIVENSNSGEMYLPIKNVVSYGEDAVMAGSEKDLKAFYDKPEIIDAIELGKKIIGLDVLTRKGERIGMIDSFFFNKETGQITHYITSESRFNSLIDGKGLLTVDGVYTLGFDALVVFQESDEIASIMKTEPGLRHKANSIIRKAEEGIKGLVNKVK